MHSTPSTLSTCASTLPIPLLTHTVSQEPPHAAPIAGLPPGRYDDWGNVGILEPNGLYHNPEKGCLIGSSASMSDCVKFLRSLEILDEDGIEKVSRTNPLKMIGML